MGRRVVLNNGACWRVVDALWVGVKVVVVLGGYDDDDGENKINDKNDYDDEYNNLNFYFDDNIKDNENDDNDEQK